MEKFIVSARKYRPQTFDTVVGQKHITETLKNGIRNEHLAQAFLFCGPRGVGKTTCARILARTINCLNRSADTEACGQCESCKSFQENNSVNIHELDAASNNSVEDIRNLVEQVRYVPQIGDKNVYIIDEVHMLSSSAFNAFLKTLEEPPSHAIFILATTEKHKIIPTILSRCQIFDFKRIGIEDIVGHLKHVAEKESIETEPEALHLIAQKADGALRDSLSIFDKLVTFTDGKLSYASTLEHLNVLDHDYFFKLVQQFLGADIPASLLLLNEILEKGFDASHLLSGLAEHLRNLMVCQTASTLSLLECAESVKNQYQEQSKACSPSFLVDALSLVQQTELSYRSANNKRLHVELCLMQLSTLAETGEGLKKKG